MTFFGGIIYELINSSKQIRFVSFYSLARSSANKYEARKRDGDVGCDPEARESLRELHKL